MLFPILRPSSLLVVVDKPDERQANRTASVLEYDRHRATSGSNEDKIGFRTLKLNRREIYKFADVESEGIKLPKLEST